MTIVKKGSQYQLQSKKTHRNLGTYKTRAQALKRERQVEFFKHLGTDNEDLPPGMYSYEIPPLPERHETIPPGMHRLLHPELASPLAKKVGKVADPSVEDELISRLNAGDDPQALEGRVDRATARGKGTRVLTPGRQVWVQSLLNQGIPTTEIANRTGVTPTVICQAIKQGILEGTIPTEESASSTEPDIAAANKLPPGVKILRVKQSDLSSKKKAGQIRAKRRPDIVEPAKTIQPVPTIYKGRYFNLAGAAQFLGVTPEEVNQRVLDRKLVGSRNGNNWKFKVDELRQHAADQGSPFVMRHPVYKTQIEAGYSHPDAVHAAHLNIFADHPAYKELSIRGASPEQAAQAADDDMMNSARTFESWYRSDQAQPTSRRQWLERRVAEGNGGTSRGWDEYANLQPEPSLPPGMSMANLNYSRMYQPGISWASAHRGEECDGHVVEPYDGVACANEEAVGMDEKPHEIHHVSKQPQPLSDADNRRLGKPYSYMKRKTEPDTINGKPISKLPPGMGQQGLELSDEPEPLNGEYWLDGGQSTFADGDVGDMNHEGYAQQQAIRDVADAFGVDAGYDYADMDHVMDQIKEGYADDASGPCPECQGNGTKMVMQKGGDYIGQDCEHCQGSGMVKGEIPDNWEPPYEEHGIDPDTWLTAHGHGDARLWAAKKHGWTRMAGNNLQTVGIDGQKMQEIADGIWDAHNGRDDLNDQKFDVEVVHPEHNGNAGTDFKSRVFVDVPFSVLESGNIDQLNHYDSNYMENAELHDENELNYPKVIREFHGKGEYGNVPGPYQKRLFYSNLPPGMEMSNEVDEDIALSDSHESSVYDLANSLHSIRVQYYQAAKKAGVPPEELDTAIKNMKVGHAKMLNEYNKMLIDPVEYRKEQLRKKGFDEETVQQLGDTKSFGSENELMFSGFPPGMKLFPDRPAEQTPRHKKPARALDAADPHKAELPPGMLLATGG